MEIKLTRQQQAVVENRGGNLLVSAAAGSGKTRVLVERLMDYVEQGENIDRFLVITFTNAAAAELRQRIAAAIHSRLSKDPGNVHLRRNATLIYKAPICTIDAFCIDFLRQWGHLLDLDPDFRLCDQGEGDELRRQALEAVLEKHYAGIAEDPAFESLVDALAGERDDQTVEDVILDMHRRVQAQADPGRWLEARKSDFLFPTGTQPEDTTWGRLLLEDGRNLTKYWLDELEFLRGEVNGDPLLELNYGPSLDGTLAWLEQLHDALAEGWDRAASCAAPVFPDLGRKRGDCDVALKERVLARRKECRDQMKKLAQRLETKSEEAMEDLRAIAPSMISLLDVTREFDETFCRMKLRRRLIDFADAEHYTARLLAEADGTPKPLAVEAGKEYVEIMVDEYQDTNAVQNTIFAALSHGDNLFMVGDVKQSIYRFRLADPTIFLDKYDRYLPYEEAGTGEDRKILLSHNFRSRPEVLDGTNFIFENIMTRAAGELDYTEAEKLRAGSEDVPFDPTCCVELNCVDLKDDEGEESEEKKSKDAIVALRTAERIRQLLDSGMMVDSRPICPEDIVILLRSPGPVLRHYAFAMDSMGIPWSAEGGYEFFGTTEISVAISMLQIVDNPRQDVPLLAVLRSPVYHFSPDQLAALKNRYGESIFDAVVQDCKQENSPFAQFVGELQALRELSAEKNSRELLWEIYKRTNLTAVFAAMPDGERRRANLMALYDEACRFEGDGHRGLMDFLLHLSRMAENGVSVPVAAGERAGGVRILSIHKSKGLEFPVVFLCGLERRFNESDLRNNILFHPELGLGPKRTDRSRMLRYSTLARDAVELRLKQQLRAEEMRLLYVAMTRAKQKLILFTAVNGPMNSLKTLASKAQCPPAPRQVGTASSMAEWVLTAALCRRDSDALWRDLDLERPALVSSHYPWEIRLLSGEGGEDETLPEGTVREERRSSMEIPADLAARLSWQYPYAAAAGISSKLTATQLKGRGKDSEAAEEGTELHPGPSRHRNPRIPCFDGDSPLTAAQKGTALHMVMQYLDFRCVGSREAVSAEINRLVEQRFITPVQGESVDPESVLKFFRSELGQRMLGADYMEREFKFSLLAPAKEYYPEAEGLEDEVLLQGVVDCWFVDQDGTITVVDFKTDRVDETTVCARAEEYRSQLEVYTKALGEVVEQKVGKRYLWFFSIERAVEIW